MRICGNRSLSTEFGHKWQDYREGHLFLPDSKIGPRTVWLSSAAHSVLDRLPRTDRWLFPGTVSL